MNEHLTDADLVAIALLPDESPETRIHLASCNSCSARLERATAELDRQRRVHEDSVESRDATFWKRQELSIMREVARTGQRSATRRSFIAAAIVAVAIGSFWFGRASVDETLPPAPTAIAQTAPTVTPSSQNQLVPGAMVSTNPWETESLSEFQPVVDWESWVEDDQKDEGTI